MYKPQDYTSVAPYLIVDGAEVTIAFLARAFGARELRRFPGPNGTLMHAEVRIDDTVVMLADGGEGWPPVPAHVHIYSTGCRRRVPPGVGRRGDVGAGAGQKGRR